MSKLSNLTKLRNDNIKKNGQFGFIYFLFAGILASAFMLLSLVLDSFFFVLLIFPFFVIPTVFAFNFLLIHQNEHSGLLFKNFLVGFKTYFSERFSSSFQMTKTLLIVLLTNLVMSIISSFAISLPLYFSNTLGIKDIIDTLMSMIQNQSSMDEISIFINQNSEVIEKIAIYLEILPSVSSALVGLYLLNKNSISIFLRADMAKYNGRYLSLLFKSYTKKNRWTMFKQNLYLSWYIYILFLLSFVGGGILGFLYSPSVSFVTTFALTLSTFVYLSICGYVSYNNKETIYMIHKNQIYLEDQELQKELFSQFQQKFGDQISEFIKKSKENKNDESKENGNEDNK